MKRFIAFLLFCLLACACLPAFAQDDFILIDGLSWSTPVEEYFDVFKKLPTPSTDGGSYTLSFSDLTLPGIDGKATAEFALTNASSAPVFSIMFVDVNKPLVSRDRNAAMRDAFDLIVREGDRLYTGRSEVVFSSAEELAYLLENHIALSPGPRISGLLGGLGNIVALFQDMYQTDGYDCITGAKAWLIDNRYAAAALYSGQALQDNQIIIVYMDIDAVFGQVNNLLPQEELATGSATDMRFGLPKGCNWNDSRQTVVAALGSALDEQAQDYVTALFFNDPFTGYHDALAQYLFIDDRLLTVFYMLPAQDDQLYDDVCAILREDLGNPLSDELAANALPNLQTNLPGADRATAWMSGDFVALCADDPTEGLVYVMLYPIEELMSIF